MKPIVQIEYISEQFCPDMPRSDSEARPDRMVGSRHAADNLRNEQARAKETRIPRIFVSPLVKQLYRYPNGGNERDWMNRLTDELLKHLKDRALLCSRAPRNMGVQAAIALTNQDHYDLYLSLGTSLSPEGLEGSRKGAWFRYYAHSVKGKRVAEHLMENYKKVYPEPNLVSAVPATTFPELSGTLAPAVMLSLAYHDNPQDEIWLTGNIEGIARNLAESLDELFVARISNGRTA